MLLAAPVSAQSAELHILPIGEGSVMRHPQGDSGGEASEDASIAVYTENTQITLTAQPAPGWAIVHWIGADSSHGKTATVSVQGVEEVRPVFVDLRRMRDRLEAARRPALPATKEGEHAEGTGEAAADTPQLAAGNTCDIVSIDDAGLEYAIRDAMDNWSGDLTTCNLATLTQIYASDLGIEDLDGIEYCTGLFILDLSFNNIADISKLSGLTSLIALDLGTGNPFETEVYPPPQEQGNSITDVSPLSGLSNLIYLGLAGNASLTDLSPLASLSSLATLVLAHQEIEDFAFLDDLDLWNIVMVNVGLDNAGMAYLAEKPNLHVIALDGNPLDDISALEDSASLAAVLVIDTAVADLTVLSEKTALDGVYFMDTEVEDLQALVDNPGIAGEDYLLALGCPLSNEAVCEQIPAIEAKLSGEGSIAHDESTCYRTLAVGVTGTGNVNPAPGNHGIAEGNWVPLHAWPVAGSGYAFDGWQGHASGTNPITSLAMSEDKMAIAVFTQGGTQHSVTISIAGNGEGSVFPGTGVFQYLDGRLGLFDATPAEGHFFGGWWTTGLFSLGPLMQFPLESNMNLTAVFEETGHTLNISVVGNGSVWPPPGEYAVAEGTEIPLFPAGDSDWVFYRWAGDIGVENPYEPCIAIVMDQDRAISARFLQSPGSPGYEPDPTIIWGEYEAGCLLPLDIVLDAELTEPLTALGITIRTHNGAYFDSVDSPAQDPLPDIAPSTGYSGTLEFVWFDLLPEPAAAYTFNLRMPEEAAGLQFVEVWAEGRASGAAARSAEYVFVLEPSVTEDCAAGGDVDLGEIPGAEGAAQYSLTSGGHGPSEFDNCGPVRIHSADYKNIDFRFGLGELLRLIQIYNHQCYSCRAENEGADDNPDDGLKGRCNMNECQEPPCPTATDNPTCEACLNGNHDCTPHSGDYAPQNWKISVSELLRLIQLYNSNGYHTNDDDEDGFAPEDSPCNGIRNLSTIVNDPEQDLFFGTEIGGSRYGTEGGYFFDYLVEDDPPTSDPYCFDWDYCSIVLRDFNAIVPAYDFLWRTLQHYYNGDPGSYGWTNVDGVLNWAIEKNQRLLGPPLIWHFEEGLPVGFYNIAVDFEHRIGHVETHIENVFTHFGDAIDNGVVPQWIVLNEAIRDGNDAAGNNFTVSDLRRSALTVHNWEATNPPDSIRVDLLLAAFTSARENAPQLKLLYNDYGAESTKTPGGAFNNKTKRVYNFVKYLLDSQNDVVVNNATYKLLDGVGLQFHIRAWEFGEQVVPFGHPENSYLPYLAQYIEGIEANVRQLTELGLDVQITEIDVDISNPDNCDWSSPPNHWKTMGPNNTDSPAQRRKYQAQIYKEVLRACQRGANRNLSMVIFAPTDKTSWLAWYKRREYACDQPQSIEAVMYDANYQRKTAIFSEIARAFQYPDTEPEP